MARGESLWKGLANIVYSFRREGISIKPTQKLHGGSEAETLRDLETEIILCRRCPRLVEWRERMAREKRRAFRSEEYWGRPVPGFGDPAARVLVVGLAPGAHGSNRTGRMFTGDASGDFLFPALHRAGFSSRTKSVSRDDGLALRDLFLSAVGRCVPPENKPTAEEIANCLPFLREEIRLLPNLRVVVALGKTAHDGMVRLLRSTASEPDGGNAAGKETNIGLPKSPPSFAHGAEWWTVLPGAQGPTPIVFISSYHPSRQNTQTGRLTKAMFDRIWTRVGEILSEER
jgi:uracil-DNA glycosylase family 4